MNQSSSQFGFGLLCRPSGIIERFIGENRRWENAYRGRHFRELLDSASWAKSELFLTAVRESGAEFDWELDVSIDGGVRTMYFVGGKLGDSCLICGVQSKKSALSYLEDLTRVNNEQTAQVRTAVKHMLEVRPESSLDASVYDDLTQLNNELLNTQRELCKTNEKLKRLNGEKNRALGMVAHDLRNPINILSMYAEFLIESLSARLTSEEMDFLVTIQRTAQSMSRLVSNVLDVSAIESGQLRLDWESIDLCDFLEGIVQRFRPLARQQDVQLELSTANCQSSRLDGDRAKLEQVFNNLLDNAIKFSPDGGTVTIRVRGHVDRVEVDVCDAGPGIDPDFIETLFQPFAVGQIKSDRGRTGTGLGLSIARRIVEGHRGSIEFSTAPGQGTTFLVKLPRSRATR